MSQFQRAVIYLNLHKLGIHCIQCTCLTQMSQFQIAVIYLNLHKPGIPSTLNCNIS